MSLKLPPSLTTVTPFSKLVALVLFVSLPFIGFYFGMQYGMLRVNPMHNDMPIKIAQVPRPENQRDLLKRCGSKSLLKLVIYQEQFTQINGPLLSPDCRHIAWSSWESGPVHTQKPQDHEGLFIYSEKTDKIERVITPKFHEIVQIQRWIDSETIEYTLNSEIFTYRLVGN